MNRLMPLSVIALLGVLLTHCASTTGMERADRTTSSMQTVEERMDATLDNIDALETTLSELTREDRRDLQAAFEQHINNLDELEKNSRELIEDFRSMESNAQNYFTEWEQESGSYENPRLRDVSEERRRQIQERYEAIDLDSSELENRLQAFISENNEIRTFLSNDLTPEGVQAVEPLVEEVREEGERLKREISEVQASINEVKTEMDRSRGNRAGTSGSGM